jgi:hypothetical protein
MVRKEMMRDFPDVPPDAPQDWRTKLARMLRNLTVGDTASLLGRAEARSDTPSLEAGLGTASGARHATSVPGAAPASRSERSCKSSGSDASREVGADVVERTGDESHAAAAVAACGCTAIALASEAVQFGGLAIFFLLAEALTGSSPVEVVEAFISGVQDLGPAMGAAAYCALLFGLQVLALCSR